MKLLVWVAKVASLAVISQKGSDKYWSLVCIGNKSNNNKRTKPSKVADGKLEAERALSRLLHLSRTPASQPTHWLMDLLFRLASGKEAVDASLVVQSPLLTHLCGRDKKPLCSHETKSHKRWPSGVGGTLFPSPGYIKILFLKIKLNKKRETKSAIKKTKARKETDSSSLSHQSVLAGIDGNSSARSYTRVAAGHLPFCFLPPNFSRLDRWARHQSRTIRHCYCLPASVDWLWLKSSFFDGMNGLQGKNGRERGKRLESNQPMQISLFRVPL